MRYILTVIDRLNREKENRRNEILAAAEKLFFSKGYFNTTIDEIASEADFTKKTVYSYFGSKDAIYGEIVLRGIGVLVELFEKALLTEGNGHDKVYGIGKAYKKFFTAHRDYFKIMPHAKLVQPDESSMEVFQKVMAKNRRTLEIMITVIAQGAADGSIRTDIAPDKLALLIVSFSEGFYRFIDENEPMIGHMFGSTVEEVLNIGLEFIGNAINPNRKS